MITVASGDRLECFKTDRLYYGNLVLKNNKPKNHLVFKIKTTNNNEISVNPNLGQIKESNVSVIVQCEKLQTNAKLLILVMDLSDKIHTNTDKNTISLLFEEYGNSPEVEKKKIEIITIDQNNLTKQSNFFNQQSSIQKYGEDSIYLQQDFAYEQAAIQKKTQQSQQFQQIQLPPQIQQTQQQQQQVQIRNSYSNSEVPNSVSRVSISEQRVLTSTTFQMQKQTPSKQSSSSQNNLPLDYPPKPQSYPYQPQQPKQQQVIQEKDPEEDPKIKKLNLSIQQLSFEYNNLLQEQQALERDKQLLLKNESISDQDQIFVGSQHIFFSALICFLIGYVVAN